MGWASRVPNNVTLVSSLLTSRSWRGTRRSDRYASTFQRIIDNLHEADDASLVASFERIDAARGGTTLTFFEYNTLAALDLFVSAYGARAGANLC